MKRLFSYAFFMAMTLLMAACNEDNLLIENRAEKTYQVVIRAENNLTDAEANALVEALVNNDVDISSMLVTTDNVVSLASHIEEELEPTMVTAMMIGFKAENRSANEERYAARIVLGGYEE